MIRRLLTCMLIAAPLLCGADKASDKTLLEIVREVGNLQDQLKAMQKEFETKFAEMGQANADQARAVTDQAGKAVTALGDRLTKGLQDDRDQEAKTLAAVAALASQLQGVASDLGTMREAMNDLTASMGKLATRIGDLSTEFKTTQAAKQDVPAPPQISATDLFANAETDRLGGKFDLALQEYAEFATKFGDSAQAPDAEYNIGSIHYSRSEWDDAVRAFDALLKDHPESKRVPEALYYKGDALARSGHWPEADTTLKDLRKRFPSHPLAKQSLGIKAGH